MNRTQVTSSYIESIGHEGQTLEIAFKDGNVYQYYGVPRDVFDTVMGAESIGKSFHEHVKQGGFTMERIEPEVQ